MTEATSRRLPVRLHYEDGEFVVAPKDQDRFFISAEKAVEACREAIRDTERVARFKGEFLEPLLKWCERNSDTVQACFVGQPLPSALPVYVVAKGGVYDFDLGSSMTRMAVSFGDAGWLVHVSQVPGETMEELASLFDVNEALQIHGEVGTGHSRH